MKYVDYVQQFREAAKGLTVTEYGAVEELGRTWPLLKLQTEGTGRLTITAGFHGEEPAGPLTCLHRLGDIVAHAKSRNVALTMYPCINPSGFEGGHRYNASGEQPSHGVRWQLRDQEQFIRSFPGYTMSDGGAAVVLEATDDPATGILDSSFVAVSRHWQIATLPAGSTMNPRSVDHTYFDMDGQGLQRAFLELGPAPVLDLLERNGLSWDDFDLVAIHQVALPYLPPIFERLGVAPDKSVITIADHGNLASVTLPLQLSIARETGLVGPGSLVLLIGLAGGISLGLMVVRL